MGVRDPLESEARRKGVYVRPDKGHDNRWDKHEFEVDKEIWKSVESPTIPDLSAVELPLDLHMFKPELIYDEMGEILRHPLSEDLLLEFEKSNSFGLLASDNPPIRARQYAAYCSLSGKKILMVNFINRFSNENSCNERTKDWQARVVFASHCTQVNHFNSDLSCD